MMKSIVFCLLLFPLFTVAQFPAPKLFHITVNYIIDGQSDWCDGHIVQGPSYCNLFSWQAPDTTNTPATLTGYRIYKDDKRFLSTTQSLADTTGGFVGSFYVTATYENPAGESDSSNVVVINYLPTSTSEANDARQIWIGFDLSNQVLIIWGAEYARSLQVFDLRGVLVWSTDVVTVNQRLDALSAGAYGVVVVDRYGRTRSKIIVKGL